MGAEWYGLIGVLSVMAITFACGVFLIFKFNKKDIASGKQP